MVEDDQGGYQCQAATSSGDPTSSQFDLLEATFALRFISQKGLYFSQLSLRRMCAIKKRIGVVNILLVPDLQAEPLALYQLSLSS